MEHPYLFKKALFGTTALIGAAVAPFPLPVSPAYAQTLTAATTTTQVLGGGGALTVTNTGSITGTNPAVSVPNVAATSVTNQGTITAATTAILISGAAGDLTGGLSNSGSISTSSANTATTATISLTGGADLSGGFANSGNLSALSNSTTGSLAVRSFYALNAPVTGAFTNTGTISTSGTSTVGSADVKSIFFDNSPLSGPFLNSGTITDTNINATTGNIVQIYFQNSDIGGNVTNTGTISNSVIGNTGFVYGYNGQFRNSEIAGDLINSGNLINAASSISGSGSADGLWIHSGSHIAGSFINNGIISSTASSAINFTGTYPVYISNSDIGGDFINTNTIEAITNGGNGWMSAWPVYLGNSDVAGVVNNSGTISATVRSNGATGGWAPAFVVGSGSVLTGGLRNSGTISATVVDEAVVNAYGIRIEAPGTDLVGGLTNTGSIIASGPGVADGIYVRNAADISGGVANSGLISGNTAIRVDAVSISGGIINSGTIRGTGGTAISLESLTGLTAITLNGGRVIGAIVDDTIANNFSSVTVADDFVTEGDITVSSMVIDAGADLTMSSGDSITLDSTLTNNGTFRGAGGIIADITNNGTIAPGYSIGTQTITGNYVQNAGGTLEIELSGDGTNDLLDITGTATLDGTARFSGFGTGGMAVGDTYTFIQTTGGVVGGFATVEDDFLFLDVGNVQIVGNDVQIEVVNRTSLTTASQSNNQTAVAQAIDTLIANGQGGDLDLIFNSLGNVEQASDLLVSQSGIVTINSVDAAASTMRQVTNVIKGRVSAPAGSAIANRIPSPNASTAAFALVEPAAGTPFPREKPKEYWIEAVGGFGSLNDDQNIPGHDYTTYGVAAGAESILDEEDMKLGTFVAFSRTQSELNNFQDESAVNSYQAGLYGSKRFDDRWHMNGSVSGSFLDFETTRPVVTGTAKGEFYGYSAFGYAELLYDIAVSDQWILSPYGGLETSVVHHESYREKGAGALNLDVSDQTAWQLSSEIGVQTRGEIRTENWSIRPAIKLGWAHQILDPSSELDLKFSGAPSASFKSESLDQNRDSARIGFDVSIAEIENAGTSFYVEYDGNLATDAQDHLLTTGIKVKW